MTINSFMSTPEIQNFDPLKLKFSFNIIILKLAIYNTFINKWQKDPNFKFDGLSIEKFKEEYSYIKGYSQNMWYKIISYTYDECKQLIKPSDIKEYNEIYIIITNAKKYIKNPYIYYNNDIFLMNFEEKTITLWSDDLIII